jgi:hypothetical protein
MSSKFRGILDTAKGRPAETPASVSPVSDSPPALPTTRPVGRPKGKRSNPGFVQATAYLPAETHHKVKLALLKERKGREFSELVGELLFEWLERQPAE